jgi:hypothetical protein
MRELTLLDIKPFIICAVLLAMNASADFKEDFSSDTFDPLWGVAGEGHTGIQEGSYHITDAADSKGTELYRSIQMPPSGSFTTAISATFDTFTSPNTKTAFSWILSGHNGNVSLMYNSFDKLELRHNDFDSNNEGLATITHLGLSDGQTATFAITYDQETNSITVSFTDGKGETKEIYSGQGVTGGSLDDFYSLRSTAKLYKFGDMPADQAAILIDAWSMTSSE